MNDTTDARETRWQRVRAVIEEMRGESRADGVVDAAAGVAFWLLLSLPAAVLAMLAAVSLLGDSLATDLHDAVNRFIDQTFTSEAQGLREAVDGLFLMQRPGLFSISIAIALFTVSRGFAGLIRALDVAYDVEESRGAIRLRLTALGLAIGTLAMVAGATFLWVASREASVPTVLRVLAAMALLIVWSATMFHIGPHHRTPWRYDLPGAGLAAIGWLVLSAGFGWYVRFAGSGNEIVGVAGAALLALTWLWAACLVFLLGAELNEIIADRAGAIDAPRSYAHLVPRRRRTAGTIEPDESPEDHR
ncbi:MAG: YihY/virulence factor BrkB family protein [Acidimicrobiia bacterium]|nr:YihY/virulence factor BrkB family protein [Acidimicrobiia bacterium]